MSDMLKTAGTIREIERLRAVNAELVGALKELALYVDTEMVHPPRVVARAIELIANAKEK